MMPLCVVGCTTVRLMLSRIHPELTDLAEMVHEFAVRRWRVEWHAKRHRFKQWMRRTVFWPKADVKPHAPYSTPVQDFVLYHDRLFVRETHCAGIRLATMVADGTNVLAAMWTRSHRAIVYRWDDDLQDWADHMVLEDQVSAMHTWINHLGGRAHLDAERRACDAPRNHDQLFHAMVVPFFGHDPKLRHPTCLRVPHEVHPIWSAIKRASHSLADDVPHADRTQWTLL